MRFEATDAFRELLEAPDAKLFEITNPKDERARNVEINISYGGRVGVWKLTVRRVETRADDPRCWTIDAEMSKRFADLSVDHSRMGSPTEEAALVWVPSAGPLASKFSK